MAFVLAGLGLTARETAGVQEIVAAQPGLTAVRVARAAVRALVQEWRQTPPQGFRLDNSWPCPPAKTRDVIALRTGQLAGP